MPTNAAGEVHVSHPSVGICRLLPTPIDVGSPLVRDALLRDDGRKLRLSTDAPNTHMRGHGILIMSIRFSRFDTTKARLWMRLLYGPKSPLTEGLVDLCFTPPVYISL